MEQSGAGGYRTIYYGACVVWYSHAIPVLKRLRKTTVHGYIILNKWKLCRLCCEDCKQKNLRILPTLETEMNLIGILNTSWG